MLSDNVISKYQNIENKNWLKKKQTHSHNGRIYYIFLNN